LGGLYRAKKDGADVETLVQGTNVIAGLALDPDYAYFTVYGTYDRGAVAWANDGFLARMPKTGGTADRLYNGNAALPLVVGSTVFFGSSLSLYSIPVSGGTAVQVAANKYSSPNATTDGSSLFYRDFDIEGGSCAFYEKPIAGGDAKLIRSDGIVAGYGSHCALRFAVDDTQLYWSDEVTKQTQAMPKGGGAAFSFETYKGATGLGLAVDDSFVYYSVNLDVCKGSIRKVPKTGGTIAVVASSQCAPEFLAVDDTHIYWVNSGDYTLRRIAK